MNHDQIHIISLLFPCEKAMFNFTHLLNLGWQFYLNSENYFL